MLVLLSVVVVRNAKHVTKATRIFGSTVVSVIVILVRWKDKEIRALTHIRVEQAPGDM